MRVLLKGQGTTIPEIALPDSNVDVNLPSAVLTFVDDAVFSVDFYRALGYTHFEALCVGAAGGRGGDGANEVEKVFEKTRHSVPQDVWDLHLKGIRAQSVLNNNGEFDHVYAYSTSQYPGIPNGGLLTAPQFEEYINPSHLMDFFALTSMSLKNAVAIGGAGGGGGLHKVVGTLADLPDSVPVVVGEAGADAELGQVRQSGVWTPDGYFSAVTVPPGYPNPPPENWSYPNGIQTYVNQITNWFWIYTYTNPTPGISFNNPLAGGGGGASSFGDVCQASGGEGGEPGALVGVNPVPGNGGDGGIGDSLVAGGGGAGSINAGVKGSDGLWLPETGIGQGGGGGKFSSAGGRGSYSFADTAVYGPGQLGSSIPGGGGGARPLANLKVGSKAQEYSPDGVVVIRVIKVT